MVYSTDWGDNKMVKTEITNNKAIMQKNGNYHVKFKNPKMLPNFHVKRDN